MTAAKLRVILSEHLLRDTSLLSISGPCCAAHIICPRINDFMPPAINPLPAPDPGTTHSSPSRKELTNLSQLRCRHLERLLGRTNRERVPTATALWGKDAVYFACNGLLQCSKQAAFCQQHILV